jgi:cation diffusion facilitator family transporter
MDDPSKKRDHVIIRTSFVGIIANIFLASFKAIIGILSHSIAVILDAVNNLSDVLSSLITIIGTRLASKKPDKEHPLGHGRAEYISAMIVSAIVLYAGLVSLYESVKKIIDPVLPDYSIGGLIFIAAAVIVKIFVGLYFKKVGSGVKSASLVASGKDALFDAILSTSVFISAIVYITTGVSLEAYVGVIISLFIIRAGIEMLQEMIGEILGRRADRELVSAIKETVCTEPEVSGAYDLMLHSYGPDRFVGSVHIEIPDTLTANEIDALERRIADSVMIKHGVLLTGIGIYSVNTSDDKIKSLRSDINRTVMSHDGVLQMHGFYLDPSDNTIQMDVILDFALDDREAVFAQIVDDLERTYPDYRFRVAMDIDI